LIKPGNQAYELAMSPSATFRVLGPRENCSFYSDREPIFKEALKAIVGKLDNPYTSAPSVPELVRQIFDPNNRDRALDSIREAIKSRSIWFHCLSATGNKILAYLAIIHDEDCLDNEGKIKLEYTKKVIRNFFDNPNDIELDDSAIRNICDNRNQPDAAMRHLIFGRNRFRDIQLPDKCHSEERISHFRTKIDDGCRQRMEQNRFLKVSLNSIPKDNGVQHFNQAVVGDMHANSVLLLHELVELGFIRVSSARGMEDLVTAIKVNDCQGFGALLPQVLEFGPSAGGNKEFISLGDLVGDRRYNDYFIVSILDFLRQSRSPYKIIFSNHDAEFIRYFLANKEKTVDENFEVNAIDIMHEDVRRSLNALNTTLNNDKALRRKFIAMVEQSYLPHLKVFSLSTDERILYAHAIVNKAIFQDIEEQAGIDRDAPLKDRLNQINEWFGKNVICSSQHFERYIPRDTSAISAFRGYPLFAAIQNIGPLRNEMRANDQNIEYNKYLLNMDLPHPSLLAVVHGHTHALTTIRRAYEALGEAVVRNESRVRELHDLIGAIKEDTLKSRVSQGVSAAFEMMNLAGKHRGLLTRPVADRLDSFCGASALFVLEVIRNSSTQYSTDLVANAEEFLSVIENPALGNRDGQRLGLILASAKYSGGSEAPVGQDISEGVIKSMKGLMQYLRKKELDGQALVEEIAKVYLEEFRALRSACTRDLTEIPAKCEHFHSFDHWVGFSPEHEGEEESVPCLLI